MPQLDPSALSARNRLIVLFVLLFILDVALVMMAGDRWAIGRILLTVVVMYFVIQGKKWARWLMMGICGLLVVSLIALVIAIGSRLSPVLTAGSLIMALLSAAIAIYLATSKDLNRYFAYQRGAVS